MNTNTKFWYQSWTVWFNVLLAAIAFIQTLGGIVPIPTTILADIAILGNFLLRFKTNTGIVSTPPQV